MVIGSVSWAFTVGAAGAQDLIAMAAAANLPPPAVPIRIINTTVINFCGLRGDVHTSPLEFFDL